MGILCQLQTTVIPDSGPYCTILNLTLYSRNLSCYGAAPTELTICEGENMCQFISPLYVGTVYVHVHYGNRVGSFLFCKWPLFNLLRTLSTSDDVESVRRDTLVSFQHQMKIESS